MSGITCQLITGAGRVLGAGGAGGGAGREGGREGRREGGRDGEREREGGGDFPALFKGTIYIQRAPHQPRRSGRSKVCFPPVFSSDKKTKIITIIIIIICCSHSRSGCAPRAAGPARDRSGSDGKSPTYLTRLGQYFGWGLGMSAGN